MNYITIPVITAIVYAIIEIFKTIWGKNERFKDFIPLIACILGIGCALIAFFWIPGVLPTTNGIVAAVIGGASGLAATGIYENIKNLFVEEKENGDNSTSDLAE